MSNASRIKLEDERHADRCERDRKLYAYCMAEGCNATFADYDRLRLHVEAEHGGKSLEDSNVR